MSDIQDLVAEYLESRDSGPPETPALKAPEVPDVPEEEPEDDKFDTMGIAAGAREESLPVVGPAPREESASPLPSAEAPIEESLEVPGGWDPPPDPHDPIPAPVASVPDVDLLSAEHTPQVAEAIPDRDYLIGYREVFP